MTVFRPEIPPHVATSIRRFPPDLKRSIKQAIRALSVNPNAGEPSEENWKVFGSIEYAAFVLCMR